VNPIDRERVAFARSPLTPRPHPDLYVAGLGSAAVSENQGSPPSRRRVLGNRMFSKFRIPVVPKNYWCRIPGEIFIMSNRKRLRQGGKFVRKTVNPCRIDLRPWVIKCRVLSDHFFAKCRPPHQGVQGLH
jgi:hypothetical protein